MNGFSFTKVVAEIFNYAGYKIQQEVALSDIGVSYTADLILEKDGKRSIVEVKYYRSLYPTITTLRMGIQQVLKYKSLGNFNKAILVVSSKVPVSTYIELFEQGVTLIDAVELMDMCAGNQSLAMKLASILPTDVTTEDFRDIKEKKQVAKSRRKVITPKELFSKDETGELLKTKLDNLEAGKNQAKQHEQLVGKILTYLFSDFISEFKSQKRNFEGMNIYDFVCRVKSVGNDFWKFVLNERNSRYVVFECKNYDKPIKQDQVLTTEKYLFLTANRSVAFLISRHKPSASAIKMAQGAIRESGKFILHLSDEDLKMMIDMKDNGEEPSDHLFKLTDEFMMTLGR